MTAVMHRAAPLFIALLTAACTPRYSIHPSTFHGVSGPSSKNFITCGPGDVFDVRVYGEPDLSGTYRVSDRGITRFPLINLVKVEGLTPTQLEEELRKRFDDGYLRDPQVTVFVK